MSIKYYIVLLRICSSLVNQLTLFNTQKLGKQNKLVINILMTCANNINHVTTKNRKLNSFICF